MKNIKKYFKKIIEILSLKELRILPAYLAYSFVLASIPLFTIIVIVAGRFNISIDTVINLVNDVLMLVPLLLMLYLVRIMTYLLDF